MVFSLAAFAACSFLVLQMPLQDSVTAGGFVYLSGTVARDEAGGIARPGDVGAQTRLAIERMRRTLEASGSSLQQVLSVTVYLRSAADFQAMNDAYRGFWPKDPPTRTTVVADLAEPDALVELSMIAAPLGTERTVVHPESWIRSPNPYSYAIRSGDTLFMSGLVARNGRDNSVVAGDVAAQTKVVLDNAREILEAAGMSLASVVSARVFLPDAATFEAMNATYRGYFPEAPPARATVRAGLTGPQYGVEITLTASSARKEPVGGASSPNLSTAIRAGRRVYLSGMLGISEANRGDMAAQTTATLERIRTALAAAGLTPADVVDSLVYVTDMKAVEAMDGAYRAFFGTRPPARTAVGAGLFAPGGVVEIMCVAGAR